MTSPSLRVLIVEDDADQRAMMRIWLQRHGFQVEEASNGNDGLHRQREVPSEVVVTDLFMPEKDGIETIDELRREYPDVKIVAISGRYGKHADFLSVAREAGAHITLKKPFDLDALLQAIEALFAHTPAQTGRS